MGRELDRQPDDRPQQRVLGCVRNAVIENLGDRRVDGRFNDRYKCILNRGRHDMEVVCGQSTTVARQQRLNLQQLLVVPSVSLGRVKDQCRARMNGVNIRALWINNVFPAVPSDLGDAGETSCSTVAPGLIMESQTH